MNLAANGIYDVNRYTGVFDGSILINRAIQVRGEIEQHGFKVIKISNTFGKPGAYQGLHFVFSNPFDGRVFELQFHTPESFEIKNKIHVDYEAGRITKDDQLKKYLDKRMSKEWRDFIPPIAWESLFDFP